MRRAPLTSGHLRVRPLDSCGAVRDRCASTAQRGATGRTHDRPGREVRVRISALVIAADVIAGVTPLRAQQRPAHDTLPAAVVQRFVDAANAHDLASMAALVAPSVVFGALPAGEPFATGRDSVRA